MPQKVLDENDPPLTTITLRLKNKSFTIFLILINILITLSLVSFDIKDASHVTGTTDSFVIHNWIGALGAQFSYYLFLSIGLAAYPAVILLFICTLRHLFGITHTANWIYVGGYFLTIFGCAMIFGCYPDFLSDLCQKLNLNQIPGGAFGSTLCHPKFGWLNYVLNTTGCTLLASAMILVGLITIYLYDWRHYSKQLWKEVSDDNVVVKDIDLKKKDTQSNQESQSQLQDTASNVIEKVNSVFSWMKVRPGRQLNTIERLGIDDEYEEVYDNQAGSATEVVPAIADSRQTFQEIDTETEIEVPQENKPLLLKRHAEDDVSAFPDEEDMPAFVDEEETTMKSLNQKLQWKNCM